MIIEFEINGARVIVSGENLSVSLTESDGGAIGEVKGKARLPNAAGVEPPPSEAPRCDAGLNLIHKHTEIASAAQGEADVPSVDRVSPQADEAITGSADANAGGSHEVANEIAAQQQTGGITSPEPSVFERPAREPKPLRPNCRNPGETCGGYGSRHCHSCEIAEVAA